MRDIVQVRIPPTYSQILAACDEYSALNGASCSESTSNRFVVAVETRGAGRLRCLRPCVNLGKHVGYSYREKMIWEPGQLLRCKQTENMQNALHFWRLFGQKNRLSPILTCLSSCGEAVFDSTIDLCVCVCVCVSVCLSVCLSVRQIHNGTPADSPHSKDSDPPSHVGAIRPGFAAVLHCTLQTGCATGRCSPRVRITRPRVGDGRWAAQSGVVPHASSDHKTEATQDALTMDTRNDDEF